MFIFKNIVVKTPLNIKGCLANMNEIYNWHKYKEFRKYLCPIICHDLLGVIIFMKRVQPVYSFNNYDMSFINYRHPIFNDIKENNFGLLSEKLVKIDYGNDYWLYNVWIDIKNKIPKLWDS